MEAAIGLRIHSRTWDTVSKLWRVDIYLNGELVSSQVELRNPWTKQQQKDARWYIEQYTCIDPYAITRAKNVRGTIEQYAVSIAEQLGLVKLIRDSGRLQPVSNQAHAITLAVTEDKDNHVELNTIQQLHWELLEDSESWLETTIRIGVKRVLSSHTGLSQGMNRVRTWPEQNASPTINILVVIARDLTPNPAVYNDVSPAMVLNILLGLQKQLTGPIRINVEVVRPATLAAFANHLADSELLHGPGFFHMVHFDMHGSVSLKSRTASLYFNEPNGSGLAAVSVREVAEVLGRHRIPFAVLNACESARANSGDDANIAQVFKSQGVKEVLAMSFKISNSAVELFLQQFYDSLLRGGETFAEASAIARQLLRSSSKRKARFKLERDLSDWFVPVVYSAARDSVLVPGDEAAQDTGHQSIREVGTLTSTDTRRSSRIVGREFDLLRLERILERQRAIYVCGSAGVGKTGLLRYACEVWNATNYMHSISYIDFANTKMTTTEQVLMKLLCQLGVLTDKQGHTLTTETAHEAMLTLLIDHLAHVRCLLVFDGLHVFHRMIQDIQERLNTAHIWKLVSDLISSAITQAPPKTYIVMSGRSFEFEQLSQDYLQFKLEKEINTYELPGLELADAMELSLTTLHDNGYDTTQFGRRERDELEHVVNAFSGNPDSLLCLLPALPRMGVPWDSLHDFLLFGDQDLKLDYASVGSMPIVWREIRHWCERVRLDLLGCMMYLGLFWHEAPIASAYMDVMTEMGIAADSDLAGSAFYFAEAAGLITVQARAVCVHPQFTLFARHIWPQLRIHEIEETGEGADPSDSEANQTSADFAAKVHLQEFLAMIQPSSMVVADSETVSRPLLEYFGMLAALQMFTITLNGIVGVDYADMAIDYPRSFRNVLCCIRLCQRSQVIVDISQWPLEYLAYAATAVRMAVSTAEAALFAQRFEDLLDVFLERIGGAALTGDHLHFVLTVLNYLAATHGAEVNTSSPRRKAFAEMAIRHIEASQEIYGPPQSSQAIYTQGFAFRYMAISLLSEGDATTARTFWQRCIDNDTAWLAASAREESELPEDVSQSEEPVVREAKQKMRGVSQSIGRAYVIMRREALSQLLRTISDQIQAGTDNDQTARIIDAASQQGYFLEHCHDTFEKVGFTGQRKFERWWPEDFDTVKWMEKSQTSKAHLVALEAAEDSGDSLEAIRHHEYLMKSAMANFQIEDLADHVAAIKRLETTDIASATTSSSQISSEDMQGVKTVLSLFQHLVDGQNSRNTSSVDFAKSVENVFQVLLQNDPKSATLMAPGLKLWLEAASDRNEPSEREELFARSRQTFAQVQKYLQTAGRKHTTEEFVTAELAVRACWNKVSEAERANNVDAALIALEELEEYKSSGLHSAFIDAEALEIVRAIYRKTLDLRQTLRTWSQAIHEDDNETALRTLQALKNTDAETHPNVIKAFEMTETLIWQESYASIQALVSSLELVPAITACEQLLARVQSGEFAHIPEIEIEKGIHALQSQRLKVIAARDLVDRKWDNVATTIEEWRQLEREAILEDPRVGDYGRDLLDAAQCGKLSYLVAESDHNMRYDETQRYHNALQELHDSIQASPEIVRSFTPMLDQNQLTQFNEQLGIRKQVMSTLGPVAGAAFIHMMRQLMDYVNPLEALEAQLAESQLITR